MDDKKIPQNASLNFYIYLKRSFYLKNLNMFYTNIINIFLTLFCIIDKQNKIYNFLYNVDGFNLTQFLLDIFEYILLLKNNSILSAKVIEMENLRNQAKDNQTYQLNHHIINEEIISVLKILLTQNYHSEFQSALISNIALNKIMNLFINKNYDEISKKEAVHNNDHISISEQNEQPQGNDETNQNTIINSSHKISLPYSNIYFKNILYKMKKKNITMKNVSYSSLETNNLDIEIYSNDENYKKNVENMSELLKVNIAIKIIKTICYSFNLIQKTHKESIPDKIHLRNVMHVLLIDLSYSIWKLNNLSQTENIVSLLFLYFNFSFVYKYDTNEFIIDTHFKKKEESNNFNFMMLKDIQSQNHDTNTGWNISTDYIKHIVEQTFIHNFFADYKKYIESTKKKEQTKKKQASHCYNHNKMVLNTIYLIKKIKNNINKRKKNIKIIDIERNFLNNKFPEEIYHQMIPFLNNRSYYLDSIQYSILLLSYNYKSTITSSFNLEYLSVLKKYFTMSFFLKNYQKKNIHLNKDIPIIYQYLLKKYLSYFTQPFSVNFKTKKRNTFLQQYNTEHSEKYLISYIQAVIRKYKKIKIFRNINYCLRQIDADRMLIENSQKIRIIIDFGSLDTGTKIIEHSRGIINIKSIQQYDYDSYMLTPCDSDIWWIYSFSDFIHIEKIGLVSLEHYASNFKVIEILGSDTYPATKWKKLGKISTNFTKSFELFNIYDHCKNYDEDNCWVKYLKFIVLSHHNIEKNYYCTLTHLQIFASSGVDMLSDKIYSDDNINQIESDPEKSDEQKKIKIQEQDNVENLEVLYEDKVLKHIKKQIHSKEEDSKEGNSKELTSKDNYYKNSINPDNFHNDKPLHNNIHNSDIRHKNSKHNAHYTNYAHYLSIEKDLFDTNLLEKELTQSKLIDTDLIKKELMDTELIEDELLNYEFIEKDIKINSFNEENIFDNITQQMQREYGENKQYIKEDTPIISNKGIKYNDKIISQGDNTKNIQRNANKYIMHPKYYNKLLKDIQNVIILKNGKNEKGLEWTNLLGINPKYSTDLKTEPFNNINIEAMKIAYHISNKIYTICNAFKNYNIAKIFKMSLITSYKHVIINFVQNNGNITFFMNREKYNYDDYTKEENAKKYFPYKNYFNGKRFVSPFSHALEKVLIILYNSYFIPNEKWNAHIKNKRIDIKKNNKKKLIWKKKKCTALNTLEYYQNFITVKHKHIILIKSEKIKLLNLLFFPKIICNNDFICLYTNRQIYERLINNYNDSITNLIRIYRMYDDVNKQKHAERTNYETFRCEQNEGSKFVLNLFLPKKLTKKKNILHNIINNISKYNTNINNNKRNTLFKYILSRVKKEQNNIQKQNNFYISILNDTLLILYIIYRSNKYYIYTLNFLKNCIDFIFKWNKYKKSNILMLTINNKSLTNKYYRIILMNILNEYNILKKKNKILANNSQIGVNPNEDYNGCTMFYEIARNVFNYDIDNNTKLETFFNANKNTNVCLYGDKLCHIPLTNNQNNNYTTN
ncbi:hypothetical protein, partial [Plasmodium yoelii yoelii]